MEKNKLMETLNNLRRNLTLIDARLDVARDQSKNKDVYIMAAFHQGIKDDLAAVEELLGQE